MRRDPPSSPDAVPLVAGIGCRDAASGAELIGLIAAALEEAGRARPDLRRIATLAGKEDHPGLRAAALFFSSEIVAHPAEALSAIPAPNPSERVRGHVGVPAIAEAAALVHGPLVLSKRKSANATCALAELQTVPVP